jgi:cytosine/adenosine deaminase-related metal-dependent hydrolase
MRERELKRAVEFAETWHGRAGGRIQALITPNLTITSSPDLLKSCRREADRLGLRLSMHLGWGDDEFRIIRDLHGVSPYAYARDTGMLGEDTVMAHCYVTTDEDTGLLARSGACVSHCPLMNAVRGHIAPPS